MKVQVLVRLKNGVLDVQGKAVEHGVVGLGFDEVSNIRIGKLIEFDFKDEPKDQVERRVTELCNKLLVNGIIENFEIRTAA